MPRSIPLDGIPKKRTISLIAIENAFVVALMAALALVSLSRLASLYETVEHVVTVEQAGLEQIYVMHSASRERTLLLHDITLRDNDAFSREEKIEAFYDHGAVFGRARHAMLALDLTETERQMLEAQRVYAAMTIPIQEEVIDLARSGDSAAARRLLDEKAMPAARRVIRVLDELLQHALEKSRAHKQEAQQKKLASYRFVIGSAVAAIALTCAFALFLTRRTAGLMNQLAKTAARLGATLKHLEYQKFALDQHAIVSVADANGRITNANAQFCDISGYRLDELLGQDQRLLLQSTARDATALREIVDTIDKGMVWRGEIRNRNRHGQTYWLEATVVPFLDDTGAPYQYVSILTDVTRLKTAEQQLERTKEQLEIMVQERTLQLELANKELQDEIAERQRLQEDLQLLVSTDTLTGIFNRRKFDEALSTELLRAERYQSNVALILFDVDHFKSINDRFGHQRGDEVLIQVVRSVQANIRESDVFARWGGEEFIVLAPETDLRGAKTLAEKLRQGIEDLVFDDVGRVTCSFGVAAFRRGRDGEDMLRRADTALYKAKDQGRNRTHTA